MGYFVGVKLGQSEYAFPIHRLLPLSGQEDSKPMSIFERSNLNKEVLMFNSSMTSEIKDLSRMLNQGTYQNNSVQFRHNKNVVSHLLNVRFCALVLMMV